MIHLEANSLSALAAQAVAACEEGVVYNLALSGSFPYAEADSVFVKTYDGLASEWQDPQKPTTLFINHGQYIHRCGNGLEFLVGELRKKSDSNRACLSLISMVEIINSHDDPIPSFMILQVGFPQDEAETLLVTAYFRALEVARFLPINLAEICQVIRYLRTHFPQIQKFDLTLNAFKAYGRPNFHCLRKASIDAVEPTFIAHVVEIKKKDTIRDWLDSKINYEESVICLDGLHHLRQAMGIHKEDYDAHVLACLDRAIEDLRRLKQMRQASSHGKALVELEKRIKDTLMKAKGLLK